MTEVVITDAHSTVVEQGHHTTVVEETNRITTVVTGIMGPTGKVTSLSSIPDIDTTNLELGSILVYNPAVSKWVSTTLLDQQNVDCGEF